MKALMGYLVILLISIPAYATVKLRLELPVNTIEVGETVKAKIIVPSLEDISKLPNLSGVIFEDTLYLLDMGPIDNTRAEAASEASIVFSKPIKNKTLVGEVQGTPVSIELPSTINVTQSQVVEEYIVLDSKYRYKKFKPSYLLLIILIVVIVGLILFLIKKNRTKKNNRSTKLKIKNELLSAVEYEDIIKLWYSRHLILSNYPHLEASYREFEKVLYKYQFAPNVSENQKKEVVSAYQHFLNLIQGELDGI